MAFHRNAFTFRVLRECYWGEPERAPQYRVLCIPTVYVYMHVRRAVYVSAMRFIPFLRKTQKKDNFKVHVSVIVDRPGSSTRKRANTEDPDVREERLRKRRERERQHRQSETPSQREERLRKRRVADKARREAKKSYAMRAAESPDKKAARLEQLATRQRERHLVESEEERQARLAQLSANQRERLANESEEERQARLAQVSADQRERRAAETEEGRQARLGQLRADQRDRRAAETEEGRQARLGQLRADQRERLANETFEERETRLEERRERDQQQARAEEPLMHQRWVQAILKKFHLYFSSLEVPTCSTCLESFPGLRLLGPTECVRCGRDKRVPKLFSEENNMHPELITRAARRLAPNYDKS